MDTLKRQKRQVKTITLHREYNTEDWGIEISGNGWQEGEWIEIFNVRPNSPAWRVREHIRKGDMLVQIQDQLVLFMSRAEVEELLGITGCHSQTSDCLELKLQIERGVLDPSEDFDQHYAFPSENKPIKSFNASEKVTIVLDPNKGIYSLEETNTFYDQARN